MRWLPSQWYLVRKQEYQEKTTELWQVTEKLYRIMLHHVYLAMSGIFALTPLVVIDTDCTGSCKSNYHTITNNNSPYILTKISVKPKKIIVEQTSKFLLDLLFDRQDYNFNSAEYLDTKIIHSLDIDMKIEHSLSANRCWLEMKI